MMGGFLDKGTRAAFLERLTDATREGKVAWSAAASRPGWYYTDVGKFGFAIESVDEDDAPPYDFHVWLNRDNADESQKIDTWDWDRAGFSGLNDFLAGLYSAARGNALGVNDITKEIFGALAQVDGGSPEPYSIEVEDSPF